MADSPTPPPKPAPPTALYSSKPVPSNNGPAALATRPPHAEPDADIEATRPAPAVPPAPQEPDAPAHQAAFPRMDDDADFPPLGPSGGWTKVHPKIMFAQAAVAARHLTQVAAHSCATAHATAQIAQCTTNIMATGRPHNATKKHEPAPNTMEVTIAHDGGFEDGEKELAFHKRHHADVVCKLQKLFSTSVAAPPKILTGCWSQNVANTGNFVLTFAGKLDAKKLSSYGALINSLFGDSVLCPVQGFT